MTKESVRQIKLNAHLSHQTGITAVQVNNSMHIDYSKRDDLLNSDENSQTQMQVNSSLPVGIACDPQIALTSSSPEKSYQQSSSNAINDSQKDNWNSNMRNVQIDWSQANRFKKDD